MSDTVKIIIEIPKETKQEFDKTESIALKGAYFDLGGIIGKAIQNGIPFDDIKAKILQLDYELESVEYDYNDMALTEEIHTICREEVLQILDKITAEKEIEEI